MGREIDPSSVRGSVIHATSCPPSSPLFRPQHQYGARRHKNAPEYLAKVLTDSLWLDGPQETSAAPLTTRSQVFTENARRERIRTYAPRTKRRTIKASDSCVTLLVTHWMCGFYQEQAKIAW